MCGIAGIFNYRQTEKVQTIVLQKMSDAMQTRGPDGQGLWENADQFVGLAHRRLSIIDLSDAANQPMHDDALSIVFNGEIYNYNVLRDTLIKKGCQFKTHSDTEVLLKLYRLYGADMLPQLRGMFSFAIWDEKNKTLFCARDHFGIKPFYYSDNGKQFYFASQVKALLSIPTIQKIPSAAGHVGFFLLGSVPEPHTLYESIQALPAGHYLILSENQQSIIKSFYSIKSVFIHAEQNPLANFSLTEALYDTVKHHMVADVDVGVFLSAGIDSATLTNVASEIIDSKVHAVAWAQFHNKKLHTVTLGFKEYKNTEKDETVLASEIGGLFDTAHQNQWIDESFAKEQFQKILHCMDQPSIDGINTYFVSLVTKQTGLKVALSGLGADEIFAGYPHFSRIPTMIKTIKPFAFIPGLSALSRSVFRNKPKHASLIEYSRDMAHSYFLTRAIYFPWELNNLLPSEMVQKGLESLNLFERLTDDIEGIQSQRFQISALEIQWYMRNQLLRDSDWASMAHSLEVRVPFVDVRFFENCICAIAHQSLTKKDLAMAPHRPLPAHVLNRKKTGFNIPVAKWFGANNQRTLMKTVYEKINTTTL